MTETIPIRDAKANLGRLVREAASGKTITITDHGHPSAMIVAASHAERLANLEDSLAIAQLELRRARGEKITYIPHEEAKAMLREAAGQEA